MKAYYINSDLSKVFKLYTLVLLLVFVGFSIDLSAQNNPDSTQRIPATVSSSGQVDPGERLFRDVVAIGLGVGLDYGGIGVNLTVYPQKNIGLFAGIGYY